MAYPKPRDFDTELVRQIASDSSARAIYEDRILDGSD